MHKRLVHLAWLGVLLLPCPPATPGGAVAAPDRENAEAIWQADLTPDAVIAQDLPRFGLNLGSTTTWGAEQLMANVLKNPGLEAGLDRGLLVVSQTAPPHMTDDAPWAARAAGFWSGAHFEVRSGTAYGASGVISQHDADRLTLAPWPPGLHAGDALAVSQDTAGPIPLWWHQGAVQAIPGEVRPGSPGQQAARLDGRDKPAVLQHYLDMLTARAGKLLPLEGLWRVSFWAKTVEGTPELQVHLGRDRSVPLLQESLIPGSAWQIYEFNVPAHDDGPPGPVTFSVQATHGVVLLDDISVGETQAGAGGFRKTVVDTLQSLRPGYLRDWHGQLADSTFNRFATPLAHRPSRYRNGASEWIYAYGIPELFALCAAIGARPWVVVPSTLTETEAQDFGRLLGALAHQYQIDETVVEFGNENWNALFRPAGLMHGATLAQVADRTFAQIRAHADGARLHMTLGGQYANIPAALQLAQASQQSEGLALGPYFLHQLDPQLSATSGLEAALHERPDALAQAATGAGRLHKSLDIYEVNFHTVGGRATVAERTDLLLRPGAGTALAQRLLQATLAGSRRQAVYTFAGFDTRLQPPGAQPGWIPLWGIVRDLTTANHWRPTGEALYLLNQVAQGTARSVRCDGRGCAGLTAVHWHTGAWAITSAAPAPRRLQLPCSHGLQARWLEDADTPRPAPQRQQRLECHAGRAEITLPPRSLLTLSPR